MSDIDTDRMGVIHAAELRFAERLANRPHRRPRCTSGGLEFRTRLDSASREDGIRSTYSVSRRGENLRAPTMSPWFFRRDYRLHGRRNPRFRNRPVVAPAPFRVVGRESLVEPRQAVGERIVPAVEAASVVEVTLEIDDPCTDRE